MMGSAALVVGLPGTHAPDDRMEGRAILRGFASALGRRGMEGSMS